jgi:hypothetical protein
MFLGLVNVRVKARTLHTENFFSNSWHGGYILRKLRIIWWPPSVRTLSG